MLSQVDKYPLKTPRNNQIILFVTNFSHILRQNVFLKLKKLLNNSKKSKARNPLIVPFQKFVNLLSHNHYHWQLIRQKLNFLDCLNPLTQRTSLQSIPSIFRVRKLRLLNQLRISRMFSIDKIQPHSNQIPHILTIILMSQCRIVLHNSSKKLVINFKHLQFKLISSTVNQQKNKCYVMRFQVVFTMHHLALTLTCCEKQVLDEVQLEYPSHTLHQLTVSSVLMGQSLSDYDQIRVASEHSKQLVLSFILKKRFFLL